ncbi:polyprenol monophosphomannose synthase [Humidisolicoccus flavus]|uniref:polyprenol monophosphomannose synthase n=1 Tax=Humidisolicoccus flavus TaxID=3111414 RepID=UPI00324F3CDD
MTTPRTLVLVPTYNEFLALPTIVERLFTAAPDVDLLILDDNSPDGTGKLADELAARDPRITVLHRTEKAGLGAAYLAGFEEGIRRGYDLLVEMDADGSHPPETLPEMIALAWGVPGFDLVIGSRWVAGGSVVDWPKRREALSRGANLYARSMLSVDVRDITAGYRVYRASTLARLALEDLDSKGYCFQIDMTLRVADAGGTIQEVPIVFRDREVGESKMSGSIIVEAMSKVTGWGIGRRAASLRGFFKSHR